MAKAAAEFSFQEAERHCYEAILKGRAVKTVDQVQWGYETKRWSEVLRPELDAAFAKCERAGIHADKLGELRTRIKKVDTEWRLVCEYRNSIPAKSAMPAFKTGAPGRPTAAHFVAAEAERRIASGEIVPRKGNLTKASEELAAWWREVRREHDGPPMTAGSVKNSIRPLWHRALSGDVRN